MLATPLRSVFFILSVIAAGWLLIALPARGADADTGALPGIQYIAAPFLPYTVADAAGHASGPTALLVEALGRRLARPGPVHVLPFARALATAENEPNTLVGLLARSPERESRFRWICPVLDYEVSVYRLRRNPVIAHSIAALKGLRVAGVMQDIKTNYLQRNGIIVIPAADEDQAVRLLLHDRVDAIASHPASIRLRLREMGERADAVEVLMPLPELNSKLWLAFGAGTSQDVADRFTAACDEMAKSGEVARLMQPAQLY
jgi:polar amino acid transport system substrate-binding protein